MQNKYTKISLIYLNRNLKINKIKSFLKQQQLL